MSKSPSTHTEAEKTRSREAGGETDEIAGITPAPTPAAPHPNAAEDEGEAEQLQPDGR